MTTQINVIVDNGGLSAKAKQQTQVNRWSKLESDNRQKVEANGTQQRDANRAQQGIGPDGRPLYGKPQAQPLRRDEPAAYRNDKDIKLIIKPTTQILGTTSNPDYHYEVARFIGFTGDNRREWRMPTDGAVEPRYIVGTGSPSPIFYLFGDAFYASGFGLEQSQYRISNMLQSEGIAGLIGVTHLNSYTDSVGLFTRHKQLIYSDAASVRFTMEAWIRPTITFARTCAFWLVQDAPIGTIFLESLDMPAGKNTLIYFEIAEYGGDQFLATLKKHGVMANKTVAGAGDIVTQQPISPLSDQWTHVALVADTNGYRCYIDGAVVLTAPRTDLQNSQIGQCIIGVDVYKTQTGPVENLVDLPVYLSQYRFSRKAKYTSNFTPPQRL